MDEFIEFIGVLLVTCAFVLFVIVMAVIIYEKSTDEHQEDDKIQCECECEKCKCKDMKKDVEYAPILIPFPIITR